MSTRNNLDETYVPPITNHARQRWHERTPANLEIEAAWRQAKPVDAPAARCSHARLYAPYNAVLPVRDGRLRTVLLDDGRLNCEGLVPCAACDDPVDPVSDATCPWCGEPRPAEQTCGRITLVRGDVQR